MSDFETVPQTPASATPDAPAPAATPQDFNSPQPATQAAPQAPATGAVPGAPPQEGWVPSYRLREARESATRQAQTEFAQREAQLRAESDQYRQKLHALVGVTPPPDPKIDSVRQQFGQLYPGLSKIEERAEQIMSMLERAGDLESQSSHYWQTYGRQSMDRLFAHASESSGGPLTDEAKRVLHASFTGFVQSSPELTERYANDPTLVEDFWKVFSSSFVDPARRAVTATVAGRAALGATIPQDTPGGVPRATPAPQHANLDERAANAWTQYQSTKR